MCGPWEGTLRLAPAYCFPPCARVAGPRSHRPWHGSADHHAGQGWPANKHASGEAGFRPPDSPPPCPAPRRCTLPPTASPCRSRRQARSWRLGCPGLLPGGVAPNLFSFLSLAEHRWHGRPAVLEAASFPGHAWPWACVANPCPFAAQTPCWATLHCLAQQADEPGQRQHHPQGRLQLHARSTRAPDFLGPASQWSRPPRLAFLEPAQPGGSVKALCNTSRVARAAAGAAMAGAQWSGAQQVTEALSCLAAATLGFP